MSLAKCPFYGGTVRLVSDRDFRRGSRYGITHEQPRPLPPTLWAAYGVDADTLVRCRSQRYGVAPRQSGETREASAFKRSVVHEE